MDDYPRHGRAGQGVIALQTSERNGALVGARQVRRDDEVMLINSSGTLVRVPVSDIPVLGRNTQGVRIMRLEEGEKLVGLERHRRRRLAGWRRGRLKPVRVNRRARFQLFRGSRGAALARARAGAR